MRDFGNRARKRQCAAFEADKVSYFDSDDKEYLSQGKVSTDESELPQSATSVAHYAIDPEIGYETSLEKLLKKLACYSEEIAFFFTELEKMRTEREEKRKAGEYNVKYVDIDPSVLKKKGKRASVAQILQEAKCVAVQKIDPDLILKVFSDAHVLVIRCINYADVDTIMAEIERNSKGVSSNTKYNRKIAGVNQNIQLKHTLVWLPDCCQHTSPFNPLKDTESHLQADGKIDIEELLGARWSIGVLLKASDQLEYNQRIFDERKNDSLHSSEEINSAGGICDAEHDRYDNDTCDDSNANDTGNALQSYRSSPEMSYDRVEREARENKVRLLTDSFMSTQKELDKQIFDLHHKEGLAFRTISKEHQINLGYRALHERFQNLVQSMGPYFFQQLSLFKGLEKLQKAQEAKAENECPEKFVSKLLSSAKRSKVLTSSRKINRATRKAEKQKKQAIANLFKITKQRIAFNLKLGLFEPRAVKLRIRIRRKMANAFVVPLMEAIRDSLEKELLSSGNVCEILGASNVAPEGSTEENFEFAKIIETIKVFEDLIVTECTEHTRTLSKNLDEIRNAFVASISSSSERKSPASDTLSPYEQLIMSLSTIVRDLIDPLSPVARNALRSALETEIVKLKRYQREEKSEHIIKAKATEKSTEHNKTEVSEVSKFDEMMMLQNTVITEINVFAVLIRLIDVIELRLKESMKNNQINTDSSTGVLIDSYSKLKFDYYKSFNLETQCERKQKFITPPVNYSTECQDVLLYELEEDLFILPMRFVSDRLRAILKTFASSAKQLIQSEVQDELAHVVRRIFDCAIEKQASEFWTSLEESLRDKSVEREASMPLPEQDVKHDAKHDATIKVKRCEKHKTTCNNG